MKLSFRALGEPFVRASKGLLAVCFCMVVGGAMPSVERL